MNCFLIGVECRRGTVRSCLQDSIRSINTIDLACRFNIPVCFEKYMRCISQDTTNKSYLRMKSNICERAQHERAARRSNEMEKTHKRQPFWWSFGCCSLALNHYILWVHVMLTAQTVDLPHSTYFSRLCVPSLLACWASSLWLDSISMADWLHREVRKAIFFSLANMKKFPLNVPQFVDKANS